jgi:GNAT superfamily N-acetyltransferase
MTAITYRDDRDLPLEPLVALYRANDWSSAEKGEALREAMRGSHSVVTAWAEGRLVGLGNTLSDGHLVVYYPHLLVHPDFRRRGIGAEIRGSTRCSAASGASPRRSPPPSSAAGGCPPC